MALIISLLPFYDARKIGISVSSYRIREYRGINTPHNDIKDIEHDKFYKKE